MNKLYDLLISILAFFVRWLTFAIMVFLLPAMFLLMLLIGFLQEGISWKSRRRRKRGADDVPFGNTVD